MRLRVLPETGGSIVIAVASAQSLIRDLRPLLADKFGLRHEDQLLFFKEQLLEDDCTLQHYGIVVNDELKLKTAIRKSSRKKPNKNSKTQGSKLYNCQHCQDEKDSQCYYCGCRVCMQTSTKDMLLCDTCPGSYHTDCLRQPVSMLPDGNWRCDECSTLSDIASSSDEDDVPGEVSSDMSTSPEKTEKEPRGLPRKKRQSAVKEAKEGKRPPCKGMANAGKKFYCITPANHFGPVPDIKVGMRWRFRIQLSECGVHRPPVAGIHGRDVDGAYSVVLSGGYEDDVDDGDSFTYTGSGGRDLSGNRRTAEQSCDQMLTRENRALAKNCAVEDVNEQGADAGDFWKDGKPVRVCRSSKMKKKFPKFAPEEGIRYDGIYKVVKYYPETGMSGFRVWKYLLRRDDPNPAPWDQNAEQFPVIYPISYNNNKENDESNQEAVEKVEPTEEAEPTEEVEPTKDALETPKRRRVNGESTQPKKKLCVKMFPNINRKKKKSKCKENPKK